MNLRDIIRKGAEKMEDMEDIGAEEYTLDEILAEYGGGLEKKLTEGVEPDAADMPQPSASLGVSIPVLNPIRPPEPEKPEETKDDKKQDRNQDKKRKDAENLENIDKESAEENQEETENLDKKSENQESAENLNKKSESQENAENLENDNIDSIDKESAGKNQENAENLDKKSAGKKEILPDIPAFVSDMTPLRSGKRRKKTEENLNLDDNSPIVSVSLEEAVAEQEQKSGRALFSRRFPWEAQGGKNQDENDAKNLDNNNLNENDFDLKNIDLKNIKDIKEPDLTETAELYRQEYERRLDGLPAALAVAMIPVLISLAEWAGLNIPFLTGNWMTRGILYIICLLFTGWSCRYVFTDTRCAGAFLCGVGACACVCDCISMLFLPGRAAADSYAAAACLALIIGIFAAHPKPGQSTAQADGYALAKPAVADRRYGKRRPQTGRRVNRILYGGDRKKFFVRMADVDFAVNLGGKSGIRVFKLSRTG